MSWLKPRPTKLPVSMCTSSLGFVRNFGRCWWLHGGAADEMVEQGHADGEAVGDLFEDAGLRAVRDGIVNFQAANHGSGMQHQRAGARELQALRRELIAQDVFLGSERR